MPRKRPAGFTILALLLWWLTIAGIGNAIIHKGDAKVILASAYALAAFVAALGLWKMKRWAFPAFLVWSFVVVLTLLVMQQGQYTLPLPAFAGFAFIVAALLSLGAFYIKRKLSGGAASQEPCKATV